MNPNTNRMFYTWWGAFGAASVYNFFERHNMVWGITFAVIAIASIVIAGITDEKNKKGS